VASSRTILVAGAGIGGLVTALALAAKGFHVAVLEQAARLEETGAGIQLSPNATRVLIGLGLGERLEPRVVAPDAVHVMSGRSGRTMSRIPLGPFVQQRYGAPYWVIHRGDLQAALVEAAHDAPDVEIRLGTRVVDYAAHAAGVTVLTRSGARAAEERGLALIGADGLRSSVRELLGDRTAPIFRHRTAWRSIVPSEALDPALRGRVHLWLGRGGHLVHYPIRRGAYVNIVAIVGDTWSEAGWSAPGNKDEIAACFARGWTRAARDVIGAPERWLKWALFDRPPLSRWSDGPVGLLGDAAHPMLPFLAQGAAMAIEDAAVLANCLAQSSDYPRALRAYEDARRLRTTRIARMARRNGKTYQWTGARGLVRNLALRMMGGRRLLTRHDWIYGWHAG
jgi:salicylate hydroxylase